MFEKFIQHVEKANQPSLCAEILATTYMNNKSEYLGDMLDEFEKWSISDFEEIIDEIMAMPGLDGDAIKAESFGEVGVAPLLYFTEAYNQAALSHLVWEVSKKHIKKKMFF